MSSREAPVRPLTVQGAVTEAVQKNLGLLAEQANLSIAEAGLITAGLRPIRCSPERLPAWIGLGPDSIRSTPRVLLSTPSGWTCLSNGAASDQLRTQLASVATRSAEAQFAESLRRLKLDVTLASIDLLEAKAKLQLAQNNLAALEQLVQLNERRLTSGAIPPLEVTRSRVAMLQYRASVKSAQLGVAAEACVQNQGGSTSLLQRKLKIGYGRAARIIDQLYEAGILGPPDGSKPRDVLIGIDQLDEYAGSGQPLAVGC